MADSPAPAKEAPFDKKPLQAGSEQVEETPSAPVPELQPHGQSHQDNNNGSHPGIIDAGSEDVDSTYGDDSDTSSYTASLLSEVRDYKYENGRRYHSYREGEYVLPNDEQEQDRQDLLHHVRNLTLGGSLSRAPLPDSPQRVLDIGTGTGIWAIDFADTHPSAEVIGTDLSPIQPTWVPPNLQFFVDDAEAEWSFSRNQPFDFIHARDLGGSITDWPKLIGQAYDHLRPGGWIELQEFEVTLKSDDDTLKLAPTLCEFLDKLHEASLAFKKPMNIAEMHGQRLVNSGFECVKDEIYKVTLFSDLPFLTTNVLNNQFVCLGPILGVAARSPSEGSWSLQHVLLAHGCRIVFARPIYTGSRLEQCGDASVLGRRTQRPEKPKGSQLLQLARCLWPKASCALGDTGYPRHEIFLLAQEGLLLGRIMNVCMNCAEHTLRVLHATKLHFPIMSFF